MKTNLILILLILGFSINLQAQNQQCEDKWNEVKRINSNDTWKEQNTVSNGKVYWKSITYNNEDVYKIFKVASTGYYYVQDHSFEKMVFYSNERDAIRALYIYANCSQYFTEQGKVKN